MGIINGFYRDHTGVLNANGKESGTTMFRV